MFSSWSRNRCRYIINEALINNRADDWSLYGNEGFPLCVDVRFHGDEAQLEYLSSRLHNQTSALVNFLEHLELFVETQTSACVTAVLVVCFV